MSNESSPQSSEEEPDLVRKIVSILDPLSRPTRQSVVHSVIDHFGLQAEINFHSANIHGERTSLPATPKPKFQKQLIELKKETRPKFATQMAAVIGYYFMAVVPEEERRDTVTIDDMRWGFGKGDFKLPSRIGDVLPHAEDAGYFVYAGKGRYRFTEFGYDQVEKKFPARQGKS